MSPVGGRGRMKRSVQRSMGRGRKRFGLGDSVVVKPARARTTVGSIPVNRWVFIETSLTADLPSPPHPTSALSFISFKNHALCLRLHSTIANAQSVSTRLSSSDTYLRSAMSQVPSLRPPMHPALSQWRLSTLPRGGSPTVPMWREHAGRAL